MKQRAPSSLDRRSDFGDLSLNLYTDRGSHYFYTPEVALTPLG